MLTANKSNAKKTLNAPPNGVSNLTMTKAQIQQRRAALVAELTALNNLTPQEERWEPKGGRWSLFIEQNRVIECDSARDYRLAGLEYQTKEAATVALRHLRFYSRLLNLATELNPSGVVGGPYRVVFDEHESRWAYGFAGIYRCSFNLFQTADAAEKATAILNRDEWILEGDEDA
jgi:hypothetical protein